MNINKKTRIGTNESKKPAAAIQSAAEIGFSPSQE